MKIEYELTKQDYIDFNIYHANNSVTMKRILFIERYIVPIIFLIVPNFLLTNTDIPLWYWYSVFIIIFIVWIVFFPKFTNKSLERRISKMFDEGKNKGILGLHNLSVTEEGIIDITAFGETKNNTIEKIAESNEYIFIYNSAISAYIVPKRIFTSLDKKSEFLTVLNKIALQDEDKR